MADFETGWSEATYRLDEIARNFDLPQLIQVTEGIDTGNEVDSFSAEDVLMIDQSVTLQKVAAQFAEKLVEVAEGGSEYAILKEEILIPMNYKGKLNVINQIKRFNSVSALARDFPRYATVLQALRVPTEKGGVFDIAAGTKIELDRVIPGHRIGQTQEQDKLVVSTESGGRKQVAMPFDMKARFRTVADESEYTLKEVIDRYSLPKIIRFLDNKIQKIYTQDLLEGVEQMANVTASALQINRLILQRVLIGHYTEPGQSGKIDKFCKRTLVVIPLDSLGIREISVKVHLGEEDDPVYEPFLVRNVNADQSMAEGLYVEFLKKPRIIRLKEEEETGNSSEESTQEKEPDEPPPLVPPRPGQKGHGQPPPLQPKPKPKPRPKPKERGDYVDFSLKQEHKSKSAQEEEENGDYEIPEDPPPVVRGHPTVTATLSPTAGTPQSKAALSLADISFDTSKAGKSKHYENVKKEKHKDKKGMGKFTGLFKGKKHHHDHADIETETPNKDVVVDEQTAEDEDISENFYDEPDDPLYDYETSANVTEQYKNKGKPSQVSNVAKARPVAKVPPQTNTPVATNAKDFRLLKKEELEQRLITCGMADFAKFCSKESLDGAFLFGMDKKMLKDLGLTNYQVLKLQKIINGWIPSP